MHKKASLRTGGSALAGWSTRKQTEPRINLKKVELVGWKKPKSSHDEIIDLLLTSESVLLKNGSVEAVRQKDKFRLALDRAALKYEKETRGQRKHPKKRLARRKGRKQSGSELF
jgi:hypothetical protein